MRVRKAYAEWNGTLKEGSGSVSLGSGAFEGAYTHASRFGDGEGTNPEELLGAAHAGCYTMFLSSLLTNRGYSPTRISTTASVQIDTGEGGPTISRIRLETEAEVPGLDADTFQSVAEEAKQKCPVSKALAVPVIELEARLQP